MLLTHKQSFASYQRGNSRLDNPNRCVLALITALFFVCIVGAVYVASAQAAYPGKNGKIAYTEMPIETGDQDPYDNDIFVMSKDGINQVQLTDNLEENVEPTFSPDGKKIAFASNRDTDSDYEIYVMDADGSNQKRLTYFSAGQDRSPTWSPDGKKIAFDRQVGANIEIYVINSDGSGDVKNLTNHPSLNVSPAWSPGGTKIAFQSDRSGNYDIFTINSDGTGVVKNLTDNPYYNEAPAWSPDGSTIAFAQYVVEGGDGHMEINVMRSDGSDIEQISMVTGVDDRFPAWSPDGTKIAFQTNRDMAGNLASTMGIYSMNADGTDPKALATSLVNDLVTPDWQPLEDTKNEPVEKKESKPPADAPISGAQKSDLGCEKVLYENRLEVPREVRLANLIKGKGIKVRISASQKSFGTVKAEINGREARYFKLYKKTSKIKSKLLAGTEVEIGSQPNEIYILSKGKEARLIKKALKLKHAPKQAKIKVSLSSWATSDEQLNRSNEQTVRALRRGKAKRKDTYQKVRQVVDRSRCSSPLRASIKGSRQTKLTALTGKRAKPGKGTVVTVECSEDCTATVGYRLWGRYEIGLKLRQKGQKKNRLLFERKLKLEADKPHTLKLGGVVSKKQRRLLVSGASKGRYDRVKLKYVIEARSQGNKSAAGEGTTRVLLRFG